MKRRVTSLLVALVLGLCFAPGARAADVNAADSSGMDWSRVPEYRIVPGDRLSIDLGPRPDPNYEYLHEVVVRPDGRITVYPIGDVIAAGRTIMELQKELITLLSSDLRSPRATIELVSSAANEVHILGQVLKPGPVPAGAFMTASQAVAAAGGFTPDAARNSVLLIHREGARTVRVARLRLDRVLKGESFDDPMVGRFDIVYVPRSTVGNLNLFLTQFFQGLQAAGDATLTGWELFNLDRIYVTRNIH